MSWADELYEITPVENIGGIWWKRDDLFAPLGPGNINGSKLRQLIWLFHTRNGQKGVASGAVKGSPQHAMVPAVAQHYGLPCVQFVGGKPGNKHPMLEIAKRFGAEIRYAEPGYAGNLNAQARKLAAERGWLHIETNITVEHAINSPERVEGFHRVGSEQCKNIPDHIEHLFIPAGSCNSLTSILYGLGRFQPKALKNVHLFRIMKNADELRQWTNERLDIIRKLTGQPLPLPYHFVEHKLVDDGFCTYEDMMPFNYKQLALHPRYEGKVLNYIQNNLPQFRSLMNDRTLFWIIGREVMQQPQGKTGADANQVYLEALSQYGPEFPKVKRLKAQNKLFYCPTGAAHSTPGRYCDLMGMPEVSDLQPGIDFRRPQYRREVFMRFYEFCLKYRIHAGASLPYMTFPYLREELGWSWEQTLWFVFINGNTQHPLTSWLIFKRFPDFGDLDINALSKWYNTEWPRLEFDTDRRHQKRDFIKSVERYKQLCNPHPSQASFFNTIVNTEDPLVNFQNIWDVVREDFYSFGRMSTFSYLEYLRIAKLNIEPNSLFLEDISGSKSLRNGLAKVLGRDDLDWGFDENPTGFEGKYTPEMMEWLKAEGAQLLKESKERFWGRDFFWDVTYFTLESEFCTYKGWSRENRRYPGVYADIYYSRIKKVEARWPEEDFSLFWKMRQQMLPQSLRLEDNPGDPGLKPEKQNHYRLTGQVIMMDMDWPCFANSYRKSSKAASAQ